VPGKDDFVPVDLLRRPDLPISLTPVYGNVPRDPFTRSFSTAGTASGIPNAPISIPGARGAKPRGFLPVPPGVPAAPPLQELPEVVVTPTTPKLSWWQQFNLWLRKPDTKGKAKIGKFVLDYYANTYMPMPGMGGGARLPRLSGGGPSRPSRQRGFLMNPAVPKNPWATPERLPSLPKYSPAPSQPLSLERYLIRTTPIGAMTIAPMPILRPTPPPGYEYDPEDLPDLIAQPQPLLSPSPVRVPAPAADPLPTLQPYPSVQPSPSPTRTPRTANPVPVSQPIPARNPLPTVTPFPFSTPTRATPTRPRDYLITTNAPDLRRTLTGTPTPARTRAPSLLRQPQPITVPEAFRAPELGTPPTRTKVYDPACVCEEEKKPKKPKKKRQPREVCYSGTFRERSKSTTKVKEKVIPCQ